MSTDLYRVRVLDLSPDTRTVTFRVFLVYYDWSGVPTDASFFLRILWDEADVRFHPDAPLGHEVTLDQYLDESWVDANTHRFVERVTQTSLRNDPPRKKIPTFIYAGFTNEDILTQGDYEVVVTDARWMQHLTKGQTWSTTSYATRAQMPFERRSVTIEGQLRAAKHEAMMKKHREMKAARDIRNAEKKAARKTARDAEKAAGAPRKPAKTTPAKTTKPAARKATKVTAAKTSKTTAAKKATVAKTTKATVAKTTKATAAEKPAAKKSAGRRSAAKKTPAKKPAAKKIAR